MAKLVDLAQGIADLRVELKKAADAAPKDGLLFVVESIEVELQVVAASKVGGEVSGGWKLLGWQAGAKVKSEISRNDVHRVKLVLTPDLGGEEGGDEGGDGESGSKQEKLKINARQNQKY